MSAAGSRELVAALVARLDAPPPAVLGRAEAIGYVHSEQTLDALEAQRGLERLTDRARLVTYRRERIDAALRLAGELADFCGSKPTRPTGSAAEVAGPGRGRAVPVPRRRRRGEG